MIEIVDVVQLHKIHNSIIDIEIRDDVTNVVFERVANRKSSELSLSCALKIKIDREGRGKIAPHNVCVGWYFFSDKRFFCIIERHPEHKTGCNFFSCANM